MTTSLPDSNLQWNQEEIFFSGDEFFTAMLADLNNATRKITLEAYIFEIGPFGRIVSKTLNAAAERGVQVRLLVDGVGGGSWARTDGRKLLNENLEVRVYHPLPLLLIPRFLSTLSAFAQIWAVLLHINRRNHRKICIIDNEIAYVGSMNIDSCHLASISGNSSWRDTGAKVMGDGIADLELAFENAWKKSWHLKEKGFKIPHPFRRAKHFKPSALVELNDKRALRRKGYLNLLDRIVCARQKVWITNAYFVPNRSLLLALQRAAFHKADVRILVPSVSDVFFMPWVASAFYFSLIKAGVRIFEYKDRVLHAKTYIIDDVVSIGSTNLNSRSFRHDLEVNIFLSDKYGLSQMEEKYLEDLQNSQEISIANWDKIPRWKKILGWMALVLRYWI